MLVQFSLQLDQTFGLKNTDVSSVRSSSAWLSRREFSCRRFSPHPSSGRRTEMEPGMRWEWGQHLTLPPYQFSIHNLWKRRMEHTWRARSPWEARTWRRSSPSLSCDSLHLCLEWKGGYYLLLLLLPPRWRLWVTRLLTCSLKLAIHLPPLSQKLEFWKEIILSFGWIECIISPELVYEVSQDGSIVCTLYWQNKFPVLYYLQWSLRSHMTQLLTTNMKSVALARPAAAPPPWSTPRSVAPPPSPRPRPGPPPRPASWPVVRSPPGGAAPLSAAAMSRLEPQIHSELHHLLLVLLLLLDLDFDLDLDLETTVLLISDLNSSCPVWPAWSRASPELLRLLIGDMALQDPDTWNYPSKRMTFRADWLKPSLLNVTETHLRNTELDTALRVWV